MYDTPPTVSWRFGIEYDDRVKFEYTHEDDPTNSGTVADGRVLDLVPIDGRDVVVWIESGPVRVLVALQNVRRVTTKQQNRDDDRVAAFESVFPNKTTLRRQAPDPEALIEYDENADRQLVRQD